MLEFLNKYWVIISIIGTILSTVLTGGWYLKGRIDSITDTVANTNSWVQDHDDSIQQIHDDVLKLKTLEEAREKGICK